MGKKKKEDEWEKSDSFLGADALPLDLKSIIT